MPYDRKAPRKRPEEKQVKVNLTLSPEAAALLRTLPHREKSQFVEKCIIEKLHPDDRQKRFAKLHTLLIAVEADES